MAKEKWTKSLLIEAENEANNGLLASFSTKSSENLVIFTRHLIRAKVSYNNYIKTELTCCLFLSCSVPIQLFSCEYLI